MQGVMFLRRRGPGLNSTCSPRTPQTSLTRRSKRLSCHFLSQGVFASNQFTTWWQQWMWAPTSLYSPWHEITAPALTDNTYRIFTSLTRWRISIKTPLCSAGCFCHRQQLHGRMNTHSVWKWGAQRIARSQTLRAELWFLLYIAENVSLQTLYHAKEAR